MRAVPQLVAILAQHDPSLAGVSFEVSTTGWDSVALIGGGMVFKFPRHAQAAERLKREARVLAILRPRLRMRLPDMVVHEASNQLFSAHAFISGEHLAPDRYGDLTQTARADLATGLAVFFADVHAIDQSLFRDAGVNALPAWPDVETVRRVALPLLPAEVRARFAALVDAYAALPPDPLGDTFGMFDCHGWNMAFDHQAQRLNGLYDFGDSGFGAVHLDFMTVGKIAHDLALRVADGYERVTGRSLDRRRIAILTGMNRILEVMENADTRASSDARTAALRWLDEIERLGVL
jgi:hypothetical protein